MNKFTQTTRFSRLLGVEKDIGISHDRTINCLSSGRGGGGGEDGPYSHVLLGSAIPFRLECTRGG